MHFPVLESVVMKAVLGEFPCWEHAGWVTAHCRGRGGGHEPGDALNKWWLESFIPKA